MPLLAHHKQAFALWGLAALGMSWLPAPLYWGLLLVGTVRFCTP